MKIFKKYINLSKIIRWIFFSIILVSWNFSDAYSQVSKSQDIDSQIHSISTLIHTYKDGILKEQGTGFYFDVWSEEKREGKGHWVKIESSWLITNKHLIIEQDRNGYYDLADSIVIHLRRITNAKEVIWEPFTLTQEIIKSNSRIHQNSSVDVVALEIENLIMEKYLEWDEKDISYMAHRPINQHHLPSKDTLVDIGTTDDVFIIGYPQGFYDEFNIFPIVKTGIISSRWGFPFNGLPCFLIDAKLFPGSSGSLIISKPIDYLVRDGKIYTSNQKQYKFLGIYSGEPFTPKIEDQSIKITEYESGIVWYSDVIMDIIRRGTNLQ